MALLPQDRQSQVFLLITVALAASTFTPSRALLATMQPSTMPLAPRA